MADLVIVDTTIPLANTIASLYTSPADGSGTIVTAFTATNCAVSGGSFKVYIVDEGDSANCPVIPFTTVAKNKFSPGSAIVNHVIPAGASIQAENSADAGIHYYITGREQ